MGVSASEFAGRRYPGKNRTEGSKELKEKKKKPLPRLNLYFSSRSSV